MISFKGILFFASIAVSFSKATSSTINESEKMCSGEIVIPSLRCMSPSGRDENQIPFDVRLYVTEFQNCKDGKIVSLDRNVSGHVFSENDMMATTHVVFSGQRIRIEDRVDNLTFELPTLASIRTKKSDFEFKITSNKVPLYEGADLKIDFAFEGSFKKIDINGKISSEGSLLCTLSR